MKCVGCGIALQTIDESKPGYINEIHIIENGEQVYCKRCFDIIHYNRKYTLPPENKAFVMKMKMIQQKNPKDVVMLIVDVLDLYSGFMKKLGELIGKMKVIILVNKIDLLPKSVKLHHIEETTKTMAINHGLNVIGIYLISAKSKKNIETVLKKIDKLRYSKYSRKPNFNNCYVVGCASVGKSTFINSVKEICRGENLAPITTSDQFQTTLDMIKVELGDKFFIVDTPGIINQHSFSAYLNYESVKIVTPKSFLKVRTYQLNNKQSLFLGGLARLDFEEGNSISVSCFVANTLYIHRTKMENAQELYENQKFKLLVPPLEEEEYARLGELKEREIIIPDNETFYDLIIPGVGFMHIRGNNLKIKLTMSEKIEYQLVKSIL